MEKFNFLVLLKPEAHAIDVRRNAFLNMVQEHCSVHHVDVLRRKSLTGASMREARALDWLYPRLAIIADLGEAALHEHERVLLRNAFADRSVLAANRACDAFGYSGIELCREGDRGRVVKLGPGAYAVGIEHSNHVVLNHFFPEFCERFYADDANVTALECLTQGQDLHGLRDRLIGYTNPSLAMSGSLRHSALSRAGELGLGSVTVARNFFHISPGYIEALIQLAFFFPEYGTFTERLSDLGVLLSVGQQASCADHVTLSMLLAESEQLPRDTALQLLYTRLTEHAY